MSVESWREEDLWHDLDELAEKSRLLDAEDLDRRPRLLDYRKMNIMRSCASRFHWNQNGRKVADFGENIPDFPGCSIWGYWDRFNIPAQDQAHERGQDHHNIQALLDSIERFLHEDSEDSEDSESGEAAE